MNRLDQVNMPQTNRRFGLPQVALLTGAFATAVLLALLFRPARVATVELVPAPPITAPQKPLVGAEEDRDVAQAKLAAAMARFANAPTKEAEPPATAAPPAPAVSTTVALAPAPLVETPAPMARVVEPQAPTPPPTTTTASPVPAPAQTVALRPALAPLSDADLRRLGDKAAQALRDGDIFGARLILERVIEGGDANALMALAETYDPRGLARMNAKGVKPDPARARSLYEQALAKGVAAAQARLDVLEK